MHCIALFVFASLVGFCHGAAQYCDAEYECVGSSVSNSGSGHVYVRGYKSNSGSSSSISVSGTQQRIYIQSEFGAYNIGSMTSNYYVYINGANGAMGGYLNMNGASAYTAASLANVCISVYIDR